MHFMARMLGQGALQTASQGHSGQYVDVHKASPMAICRRGFRSYMITSVSDFNSGSNMVGL